MAYEAFKPEFWASHYEHELGKICVLTKSCDYSYEGNVKYGSSVRVLGVGKPTLHQYTGAPLSVETVQDNSVLLPIDQQWATFFKVDDVDKAQSVPGLLEALMKECITQHAEKRDSVVAALAAGSVNKSEPSTVQSADDAKALVDAAFETLWDKGVGLMTKMDLFVTPYFYNFFKEYLITNKTDNEDIFEKGVVGMYNNANVIMTNNLYSDANGYDYCMLKTKKAIAFAAQIEKVEKTRLTPTGVIADAVISLDVFGARIVRQDEIYTIIAKKAS